MKRPARSGIEIDQCAKGSQFGLDVEFVVTQALPVIGEGEVIDAHANADVARHQLRNLATEPESTGTNGNADVGGMPLVALSMQWASMDSNEDNSRGTDRNQSNGHGPSP